MYRLTKERGKHLSFAAGCWGGGGGSKSGYRRHRRGRAWTALRTLERT